MPINLTIQAEVIDLRSDRPYQDDIFLVDNNVWLWQTYTNAIASSRHAPNKIRAYTPYLSNARRNGATLVYSGLILAELAHVIEKTERQIYNQQTGHSLDAKEYRHNHAAERANVVAEVESAWAQVEGLAVPVDLTINENITNASLARFKTQALDGYDLLILEAISRAEAGHVKVITDDMDYAVVPGIQVFTNNGLVIQQATVQGKLCHRVRTYSDSQVGKPQLQVDGWVSGWVAVWLMQVKTAVRFSQPWIVQPKGILPYRTHGGLIPVRSKSNL